MAVVRLRCPDCSEKFKLDLEPGKFPDYCPCCGSFVGVRDPDFVPTQMNIGSLRTKVVDGTYREMEDSSIARAEAFGQPSMKITNLPDNLREGDVGAPKMEPSQDYKNALAQTIGEGVQHWQQPMGTVIADARLGARQGTGVRALSAIQAAHGTPSGVPVPARTAVQGSWGAQ